MPKIDLAAVPVSSGTTYPDPFAERCLGLRRQKLGDVVGLDQFGVNLLRLPPGQWSSQRHWEHGEDEFVWVLEGEVVLVTDAGEEVLRAGDCAGFKSGVHDAHHFQNRSHADALLLEVGTRSEPNAGATYPDIDLRLDAGDPGYAHKDGARYPVTGRRSA